MKATCNAFLNMKTTSSPQNIQISFIDSMKNVIRRTMYLYTILDYNPFIINVVNEHLF